MSLTITSLESQWLVTKFSLALIGFVLITTHYLKYILIRAQRFDLQDYELNDFRRLQPSLLGELAYRFTPSPSDVVCLILGITAHCQIYGVCEPPSKDSDSNRFPLILWHGIVYSMLFQSAAAGLAIYHAASNGLNLSISRQRLTPFMMFFFGAICSQTVSPNLPTSPMSLEICFWCAYGIVSFIYYQFVLNAEARVGQYNRRSSGGANETHKRPASDDGPAEIFPSDLTLAFHFVTMVLLSAWISRTAFSMASKLGFEPLGHLLPDENNRYPLELPHMINLLASLLPTLIIIGIGVYQDCGDVMVGFMLNTNVVFLASAFPPIIFCLYTDTRPLSRKFLGVVFLICAMRWGGILA